MVRTFKNPRYQVRKTEMMLQKQCRVTNIFCLFPLKMQVAKIEVFSTNSDVRSHTDYEKANSIWPLLANFPHIYIFIFKWDCFARLNGRRYDEFFAYSYKGKIKRLMCIDRQGMCGQFVQFFGHGFGHFDVSTWPNNLVIS